VLPGLTYGSRLCFEDDGVEFFHTPGHTEDSSSCYDRVDGVLLAGDNVELPLPYLYWDKLGRYLETLEGYLKLGASRVIAGHHPLVTGDIIGGNMEYLGDFGSGKAEKHRVGEGRDTHARNMAVLERLGNSG
ncbi:MAG TPA: Zn-dependent hydrolase, partial [candidate division Zixibacteria bacterium]|nr:Zn-dependent hydrolase [candidate division Zixibacteria bacterium]